MANYNKSFNFKKGLQVDTDNFVVNPNGLVGIGTSIPKKYLDVYGETRVTGLATVSNLYVSGTSDFNSDISVGSNITLSSGGDITASNFYGNGNTLSNIVGYSTESWIVNVERTGLSTTLNVGIGTDSKDDYDLVVGSGVSISGNSGNINLTGTITANSFSGSGANLTSLSASNISTGTISDDRLPNTITSNITGNLTGNASSATVADGLQNTPNIDVGLLTATNISGTSLSVGLITSTSSLHLTETTSRIGIGTALPTTDLQIRRSSGNSVLQVVSDNNKARIGLGNSIEMGGNRSAEIRFYNKNLEFYNYDVGNIDTIIHEGTGTGTTGNFRWIYDEDVLLTLTYDGNLGINEPNPTHKLHVGGASTFTGAAHFANNVTINGSLSFTDSGTFTLPPLITSNINTSSGISTFNDAEVTDLTATNINLGTELTSAGGAIGIGTDTITPGAKLDVNGMTLLQNVGVGTTNVRAAVDFADANNYSGAQALRFMLPPILNGTERSALSPIEGAVIYNTDASALQVCTGLDPVTWVDLN